MFRKFSSLAKRDKKGHHVDTSGGELTEDDPSSSSDQVAFRRTRYDTGSSLSIPTTRSGSVSPRRLPSPRGRASTDESGPLGLGVVYTPDHGHKVDIVFVHGLGGTSRWTWSKDRKAELFWPLTFLPLEPDICLARIMTFGYNASFQKSGNTTTSVLDFAKDLLFDLKYGKDPQLDELNIGKVPLIFVVHSMGGLIVKEGQHDPEYEAIVKAVSAITFLSTPHRGTMLAQTLGRILDSMLITTSKQYIADLTKNSLTLQKLNEQFRHVAPKLDIVSFYETLPTPIGLKSHRVMVLEKDSSVLGYPGEISKALDADHHNVCKFHGPQDPNYITVRNVLKTLVSKIISQNNSNITTANSKDTAASDRKLSLDIKNMLGISELPTVDYIFYRDQWSENTNQWILENPSFREWLDPMTDTSRILWLSGPAASGKSVLSSYIVNHLVEAEQRCQYFFIRFSDRKKRTPSMILRSLAFQIAQVLPDFLKRVVDLQDHGIDFETADPRIIWETIFKSILFTFEPKLPQPLYWVVDGLDEADDPRAIIKLLSTVETSRSPIRILITSRQTSDISSALDKVPSSLRCETITFDKASEDVLQYVRQEIRLTGNAEYDEELVQKIVQGSQCNFLWVHLAVERVNQCHTREDIEQALEDLPPGMDALYDRMASNVANIPSLNDKALAVNILDSVVCSLRILKLPELAFLLGDIASKMLDLPRTIIDLCGHFVVVDNSLNVSLLHKTAREYLLNDEQDDQPFKIDKRQAHKRMFTSCMQCLMANNLRISLTRGQRPVFLDYAATYWSSHLVAASVDDEILATLKRFLSGNCVLTWIYAVAESGTLRLLAQASRDLSKYAAKHKREQALGTVANEMSALDLELVDGWAVDLLRVVGKFNRLLRRRPDAIYKGIPPFCPKTSSIYQTCGKAESKSLAVMGLAAESWDDSVAKIMLGSGPLTFGLSLAVAGSQIALLSSAGDIFLQDSVDFIETKASPLRHAERVSRIQFNAAGSLLVTYGYRTVKIWETSTGKCKVTVPVVQGKPKPLAMLFVDGDSTLLIASDDRKIRSLDVTMVEPTWELFADVEEPKLEGYIMNAASHIAFNGDGSMVAVAYRSHPMSAWELDGPFHVGHCFRKDEAMSLRELREVVWHPLSPIVLAVNIEGDVIKWSPYESEVDEIHASASKIAVSRDGELFATGDSRGRTKLFATSTMSLIHHFAAQDAIYALAFSPDSTRLYDLRGYFANAWEPNALVRLGGRTEGSSDSISEMQSIVSTLTDDSLQTTRVVDSIVALAACSTARWFCSGTQKGVVWLHDAQRGRLRPLNVSGGRFAIGKIVWSADGGFLCYNDMGREITVMRLVPPGVGQEEPVVEHVSTISPKGLSKGGILHMLFNADATKLLVQTLSGIHIIGLPSAEILSAVEIDEGLVWLLHPTEPDLVVGFGAANILMFDWALNMKATFRLSPPTDATPDAEETGAHDSTGQPDRVLITMDKKRILLHMTYAREASKSNSLFYFDTAAISGPQLAAAADSEESVEPPVHLTELPFDIISRVATPLGLLIRDRLIFLSKDFSICRAQLSWRAPSAAGQKLLSPASTPQTHRRSSSNVSVASKTVEELFALPGDWVGRDCLTLCCFMRAQKSLLCPRNGEVAIVKAAALG